MDGYFRFADLLLDRLVWTSIQAGALIGAVWLLCRWLPRWSPAMRCLLWWLVGLQLMLGLMLGRPLELPLLTPSVETTALSGEQAQEHGIAIHTAVTGDPLASIPVPLAAAAKAADAPPAKPWPWRETLASLWLIAMALQLVAALREWRETRAVMRSAEPVRDTRLLAQCAEQARALGLRHCPELRRSDVIVSPQVAGLWRPVVLLPTEHTLDADDCAMALAHELAHLRRGDLWLGWIPALAQRAFFFHPLARWAMREYAFHREAACDAQVLDRSSAEPQDYGRLLLRLGVAFPVSSGLAGASPTFQNLKRRLTLLQQTDRVPPRLGAWLLVALVALAGALPYRVTARGMDMTVHAGGGATMDEQQATSPAPAADAVPAVAPQAAPAALVSPTGVVAAHPLPAVAAAPAPVAPMATTATPAPAAKPAARAMVALGPIPTPPPAPMAPMAPMEPMSALPPPPVAPVPPPPPPAPPSPVRVGKASHVDIDLDNGAPRGFAIVEPDFLTVQGSENDLANARALQNGNAPVLWIRRGDKAYVVRDRALLQQAKDAYAPMRDLARQQGEFAGKQGELAGRQGGLAAEVGALSVRRSELDSERVALTRELQQQRMQTQANSAEAEGLAASFEGRLSGIEAQRADLQRQQADIDRRQADFSRNQAELSRQQAELSKREREVSRQVYSQLDRLMDQAVADGLAQPSTRL
ncbi:peptidase M56 [Dyella sp. LX-66]|uniref:M56 family metallopeptidase n=1 Tax=unclassified Dyella TaxID=2634549 RepID=UPI001BE0F046|nr:MULTISPECIES: M56 family metallopeptidase [unclassified Dyella]MBT2116512.1 peptidase M56 [Dyella sp. LX-1]MBT2140545.1 peptidase M56 [Dyella sp. LX-66]